ncbi:MAG: ClpXP protease specificity-enhancing factor [Gammaproteobacteria bacterium]|nr:ClpXP protease specificity-enhancing factor [Gammaproteobacteria bacterium]
MKSNRPYLLRALYEWILDSDCTPYVVAVVDFPGVDVPAGYVSDGRITLNVSPQSVRQLVIGDDMLTFDGRFSGTPYRVTLPSGAIVAIYARETGQGMAFEAETPAAVEATPSAAEGATEKSSEKSGDDTRKGPSLRVIK